MGDEDFAKKGKAPDLSSEVLPLEMFYEILPRLPLRTLMKFKSVCRQWNSTIREQLLAHEFLAHHARDQRSPTALISFTERNFNGCLFFSLDLETGDVRPIHNLNEPPFTRATISETLNGLICFELDDLTYLCNLSTGELASLPAARPCFSVCSSTCMPSFSSLGFDPEKREYKIMRTWASMIMDEFGKIKTCHKILKLGTGIWNNMESGLIDFQLGGSVFLNGAIHYLTLDLFGKKIVIAFDVGQEKFREMSLPNAAASSGDRSKLVIFKGHLALLGSEHLEDEDSIIVYKLNDYENQLWEEQRIVLPPNWREARENYQTFHVTTVSTGELLLMPKVMWEQLFVLLYNPETSSLKRLEILGLPESQLSRPFVIERAPIEYIESILSISGTNEQ
ncbi:putative F-box protein At1g20657 [Punica granatum]|nr:putative F-box protein At1g20657 [Punica granatum]PKI53145.1 hypothetical protein CRG98_026450 [Punica granatum]